MSKLEVFWTINAKEDLKEIYISLKNKASKETALKTRMNYLTVQVRLFLQNSFN